MSYFIIRQWRKGQIYYLNIFPFKNKYYTGFEIIKSTRLRGGIINTYKGTPLQNIYQLDHRDLCGGIYNIYIIITYI